MGSLWAADKKEAIALLQGQIIASLIKKMEARKKGGRGGCSFSGPHQSRQLTLALSLLWLPANHTYVSSVIPIDFNGTSLQGSTDLGSNFTRCEHSQVLLNPILNSALLHFLQEGAQPRSGWLADPLKKSFAAAMVNLLIYSILNNGWIQTNELLAFSRTRAYNEYVIAEELGWLIQNCWLALSRRAFLIPDG